jgi:hypothetical protein
VKANLRSLDISLDGGSDNLIQELNLPAQCNLQDLFIYGHIISKVPRWIGSLVNLQKLSLCLSSCCHEDVEILGGLPDLRYIRIAYNGPSRDELMAAMEILIAAHPNHPTVFWQYC